MARKKKDRLALRNGYPAIARALHDRNPHRARAALAPVREAFERADYETLEYVLQAIRKLEAAAPATAET